MKIDYDVVDVLTQAVIVDNTLKLVGNIDRKLYIKVNSVLESVVTDAFAALSLNQEPLGYEFERVLFENLWDLYQS